MFYISEGKIMVRDSFFKVDRNEFELKVFNDPYTVDDVREVLNETLTKTAALKLMRLFGVVRDYSRTSVYQDKCYALLRSDTHSSSKDLVCTIEEMCDKNFKEGVDRDTVIIFIEEVFTADAVAILIKNALKK